MGGFRKNQRDHTERTWNSLTTLKRYLETSKKEKVKSFNGYELITNKGTYTMYDRELNFEKVTRRRRA